MIRCYDCPLRDICSTAKARTEEPLKVQYIPDRERQECPLYRSVAGLGSPSLLDG